MGFTISKKRLISDLERGAPVNCILFAKYWSILFWYGRIVACKYLIMARIITTTPVTEGKEIAAMPTTATR